MGLLPSMPCSDAYVSLAGDAELVYGTVDAFGESSIERAGL